MSTEKKELLPYIDPIPSTATIAMLAATMKSSPERALELWVESARMIDGLRDMSPAKRRAVLGLYGRDWCDGGGFMDNSSYRVDLQTAMNLGLEKYPIAEAMKMIGISTEKTLWKIWEYSKGINAESTPEKKAQVAKEIEKVKRKGEIDEDTVSLLEHLYMKRRAEIGRQNRLQACQKRTRRKPVK